jgi:uroporphyrinogen III methyltransferase / synthase
VAERPLEGRRILVTRPREQAGELAAKLQRLGAHVVVMPLIAIEAPDDPGPLQAAIDDIGRYDWLVFTSANGVRAVRELLAGIRVLGGVKLAAVGSATAEALTRLGAEPSFVPERFAAEEIASGLGSLEGARVLLPLADIADQALADELRRRGAVVDAVVAYRTAAVRPAATELEELGRGVDVIVLASGSAARSLASLVASSPDVRSAVWRVPIACIGPKTVDVARAVGLPVGLVAHEATSEGIIQALVSHFQEF